MQQQQQYAAMPNDALTGKIGLFLAVFVMLVSVVWFAWLLYGMWLASTTSMVFSIVLEYE